MGSRQPVISGRTRPHDAGISSIVSREAKTRAEQVLLGAMLREPFNLSNHIQQLNRVALSNAHNDFGGIFLEILDQFQEKGNYSITTIAQKIGSDGFGFHAAQDTDVDLSWAVEIWWQEYSVWAESTALMRGVEFDCINEGAMKMREEVEAMRETLGANGAMMKPYDAEDFAAWGADKLAGNEPTYPTTAPIFELRNIVRHFKPRYMWIIAGAAGMGKTQWALNLVSHFHDQGATGLFFSLEMTADDVFKRLLGIRHGINHDADWAGFDEKTVGRALTETASLKDTVDVIDNVFSIAEIEAVATAKYYAAMRGGKPLQYIFVDYLQMVAPSGKHQNRESEVGSVSAALARLSKRLNCPLFALCPISREVMKRGGSKRPVLADLRESGRIEYDAYGVMFMYRPEYYGIKENESGESLEGRAEIIVAKHRNGRVGTAMTAYHEIRGFRDIIPESKFPTISPVDFTLPTSARPEAGEDIPF